MRRFTYFLLASAELLPPVPVARVTLSPAIEKVVVAWMSTEPGVVVVIVTEQVPPVVGQSSRLPAVPPQLAPSFGVVKAAPAVLSLSVNTTQVPLGAGPKPLAASPPGAIARSPSSCCTVTLILCGSPTLLTAVSGSTSICAST